MRRANAEGGFATVLAKGDTTAGAILFIAQERGENPRAVERGIGPTGETALIAVGPQSGVQAVTDYWMRRCKNDPDLWVVEVDIVAAERFVAETIFAG